VGILGTSVAVTPTQHFKKTHVPLLYWSGVKAEKQRRAAKPFSLPIRSLKDPLKNGARTALDTYGHVHVERAERDLEATDPTG